MSNVPYQNYFHNNSGTLKNKMMPPYKGSLYFRGCHGHDRMVVGFVTTYAISAYHH